MNVKIIFTFLVFVLLISASSITMAGAARDAGNQTAKKMQYMMRQLASEKDLALAEVAKLKKEMEKIESKAKKSNKKKVGLIKKMKRTEEILEKYKQSNESMRDRIMKDREKSMAMVDKFRETVGILRRLEREKSTLATTLKTNTESLDNCTVKNNGLYVVNADLIKAYNEKGVMDVFWEKEPLIGIKNVEIEIAAQDNRKRIAELKFVNVE